VIVLVTFPGVTRLDAFSRSTIFIADVAKTSAGPCRMVWSGVEWFLANWRAMVAWRYGRIGGITGGSTETRRQGRGPARSVAWAWRGRNWTCVGSVERRSEQSIALQPNQSERSGLIFGTLKWRCLWKGANDPLAYKRVKKGRKERNIPTCFLGGLFGCWVLLSHIDK